MAHYKRKKSRVHVRSGYSYRAGRKRFEGHHPCWMCWWPAWHDIVHHRRPPRRRARAMEHKTLRGADPDAMCWPLDKRPHVYYW